MEGVPHGAHGLVDERELGLLMAGITDTDKPHSEAEIEANLAKTRASAAKEA